MNSTLRARYCSKCIGGLANMLGDNESPEDILDENRDCFLCGDPKVCPVCSREQDERFGDFPLLVCMDCIAEAKHYLKHIAEVSEDINSTLRLREAEGWKPLTLVIDATLQEQGVVEVPLKPGMTVKLKHVPMVFAVAIVTERELGRITERKLDFVNFCPAAVRDMLMDAVDTEALKTGTKVVRTDSMLPKGTA